ncbi:hypothetical protein D3C87_1575510 [compost metagenome]
MRFHVFGRIGGQRHQELAAEPQGLVQAHDGGRRQGHVAVRRLVVLLALIPRWRPRLRAQENPRRRVRRVVRPLAMRLRIPSQPAELGALARTLVDLRATNRGFAARRTGKWRERLRHGQPGVGGPRASRRRTRQDQIDVIHSRVESQGRSPCNHCGRLSYRGGPPLPASRIAAVPFLKIRHERHFFSR